MLLELGEERVKEETGQKGKVFTVEETGFIRKGAETTELDHCAGFLESWVEGKE